MARNSGAAGPEASGGRRAESLVARRERARRARRRRLIGLAAAVGLAAVALSQLRAGGGNGGAPAAHAQAARRATGTAPHRRTTAAVRSSRAASPLLVRVPNRPASAWTAVAWVRGQATAWLAQHGGVSLMRFDQRHVHVTLHAGYDDGGTAGWVYGDAITAREIHKLVAGFNGGFKLSYANVGFEQAGHVAVPLKAGLASIVTYSDGTTAIGAWKDGVPSGGKRVFSVLQNQFLLVDRGVAAANVSSCVISCWGATIQGLTVVARAGLGVRSDGQLVWAAGERMTPASLASALIGAGAVRAIELDINPDWVAGYLYTHHSSGPAATPVVPGQVGIAGQLLAPDSRDFLAIVAN
jgi:hypothetical protein